MADRGESNEERPQRPSLRPPIISPRQSMALDNINSNNQEPRTPPLSRLQSANTRTESPTNNYDYPPAPPPTRLQSTSASSQGTANVNDNNIVQHSSALSLPRQRTIRIREQSVSCELDNRNSSIYTLEKEVSRYLDRSGRDSLGYQYYPGTEMTQYDFTAERLNMYSTNIIESSAHLIKCCLGAGILSIHEAFMYGGIWTSLVTTLIIGAIIGNSMFMLGSSAHIMYEKLRVTKLSYSDLAEVSVASAPWKLCRKGHKFFRHFVELFLFLEMCGTCCIYQIIIANTIKEVMANIYPHIAESIDNIRIYIMIVTIPLLLLCMITSLKYLAPFSIIADIFVATCVLTTLYYSFQAAGSISERPAWNNFHGFLRFCGICIYSIDGVDLCLPVENNMKKPKYFTMVVQIAISIVTVFIALTGFFGYWGWGEDCRSPITVHIPHNIFTTILQILLALMLSITYAVQFWVPFRIVWHYAGRRYKRRRAFWERLHRVIHVLVITCIAVLYPNLINLMVFLGNFFLGFSAFVFPAIIETLTTWDEHQYSKIRWILFKNILMFLTGILLIIGAFYSDSNTEN